MEIDIKVLGGLPVTVSYTIDGPDYDVGYMSAGLGEWEITHINGKRCKKPPQWLYNRLDAKGVDIVGLIDNAGGFDERNYYDEGDY